MLDERIQRILLTRHQNAQERGELLSTTKLEEYYATFRRRFGPDVLAHLDGEALLTTMHEHGNRDSLVYWLEFKNDDELQTIRFGSIAGGSALKFGLYKRTDTGNWMTGSSQRQQQISVLEAVGIARRHRDQILAAVERLTRVPEHADDGAYAQLQADLAKLAPDLYDTAWGHKYFCLLFPDRLDDFHVADYQRFHLVKLLQVPPPGEGRYLCAGRFVAAARALGMPINHLSTLLWNRFSKPYRYWRVIGNNSDKDFLLWDMMRTENCVALGWREIGDLSALKNDQASRGQVKALMNRHYRDGGRWAEEVFWFAMVMAEGDLVLAFEGKQVLGIGRVRSGYHYVAGSKAPHRRQMEWLDGTNWLLPEAESVAAARMIKNPRNQVEIERHLLEPVPPPPPIKGLLQVVPLPGPYVFPTLPGVAGRIQSVLDRKRQVILYGPPGTGKTYWARLAALDLAAHAAFEAPFDGLAEEQKGQVLGDGADQAGLVRLCAFHPAYGYEDFLEGYRPIQTDGQLAFERRDGVFKRLCDDARRDLDRRHFLIVDEINRGDIPRIFGELLTVLERDKRGQPILLPLSGQPFSVPDNVYLIGTMNTADRSIALLDTALRRRFGFVELMPDSRVLGKVVVNGIPLGPWLDALNRRIREHVGRDARNLQVGHAYLMDGGGPVADFARLACIVRDDLIPLLEEYCYEDYDALEKILGSALVDRANQRIRFELFDSARQDELIAALLAPAPEIATTLLATTTEDESPGDEPVEGDESGDDDASPTEVG